MEDIQIIDAPRIKGYLDLDSYFIKKLGKNFLDDVELYKNGLIEYENSGRSEKFWILDEQGERIALYKEPINYDGDETYAELISEEISKILGMPTAHYDLALYRGTKGVISYNFVKEYFAYNSGFDIIADFYERYLQEDRSLSELYGIDYDNDSLEEATNKLNNLEDVWFILEQKYKDHPYKKIIVSRIVNGLVNKLIFDILTVNIDDHSDNWGELERDVAPQFDNARIINLHKNILTESFSSKESIEDKELSLIVDNSDIKKPLEVLEHFLDISSSEYKTLVIEKLNILRENIDHVPNRIEKRTEAPMPDYLKKYLKVTMDEHLNKVDEVVNGSGRKLR